MSKTTRTFESADQFNDYAKKEAIKSRALAILIRDPEKRQNLERKADALDATRKIFDEPMEKRLLTTDRIVIPRCEPADHKEEPADHKAEDTNEQNERKEN